MTDEAFQTLLTFIERHYSFATSQYSDRYLKRRVDSRIRRNKLEEEAYEQYRELLEEDDGTEQAALLDTLSVNVTSFFRNQEVWEELRNVLRTLEAERSYGSISAWSVPCSDGREPYSLAMLAADTEGVSARNLTIRGSDIDEEILKQARRGVYQQRNTADIESELGFLDDPTAYVEVDADSYQVRQSIKDRVEFDRYDLINGDQQPEVDLIFCRNFFIYVDNQYKEPVLEKLDRSIPSGGYLVLGKTESIPYALKDRFEPVSAALRIYQRV